MLALSGLSRAIQGGSEASWVSRAQASQAYQASQGLAAAGWGHLCSGWLAERLQQMPCEL